MKKCFPIVLPLLLVYRNVIFDGVVLHVIAGRTDWRTSIHGHSGHLLMELTELIV